MSSKAIPESTRVLATVQGPSVAVTVMAAWLVPGAGHLLQGRMGKAAWFFVLLSLMYAIGLGFAGRLFPFQLAEPLVFLAAIAEWSVGAARLVALAAGGGAGEVTAVTHGAQDLLVVRREGQADVMVPFVHDLVPEIDLDAGRVVTDLPDGLLDLTDNDAQA